MVHLVTRDNLGGSFEIDQLNQKLEVKVAGAIARNVYGAVVLDGNTDAFKDAVRNAETRTTLKTEVTEGGSRYLVYAGEGGDFRIDLTAFLQDIHVDGLTIDGKVLTLTNSDGEAVTVDLGVFLTEDDTQLLINNTFDTTTNDAFGVPLFKVKGV